RGAAAEARALTAAKEGLVARYHAARHRLSHCASAKRVSASVAPMSTARGIAFKLVSAALFAVMSALVRHLGARYPVGQVVFTARCSPLFRSCLCTLGGANSPPSCAPSGRSARRAGVF